MLSQREVEKKYNALMVRVKNDDYYKVDLTKRVNCYTCAAGHITKTRDIDAGVTPMFHTCEICGIQANSTFFKDIAPHKETTQEWYRPTLKELLKKRNNPGYIDHVLNGGLAVRAVKK